MKTFIYVQSLVSAVDPEQANLLRGILEKSLGETAPDIIPQAHASTMRFRHTVVPANSTDEAYCIGSRFLPPMPIDVIAMSDYVIEF
jgi:hypothetical protein